MNTQETSIRRTGDRPEVSETTCCIVGGGPAGAMLGLLLARKGVDVLVLEKHGDFLRDFRGDTIHPSTMEIMSDLGLAVRLLSLKHTKVSRLRFRTPQGTATLADFSHLKTRFPYVTFMPQWDFLDFVTGEAARYPNFRLQMNAEVEELIEEYGVIRGIHYQTSDGSHEVRASLTVAADGHSSRVRERSRLEVVGTAPPIDVLWFRLPRREGDPGETSGYLGRGRFLVLIDRGDYWQIAYVVPKGAEDRVRAGGLEAFKESIRATVPELADQVDELRDWDQVKLLSVQVNRLRLWYLPGLLCIGDAAHAMSPVGGVGINLAIHDAVRRRRKRPREPTGKRRGADEAPGSRATATRAADSSDPKAPISGPPADSGTDSQLRQHPFATRTVEATLAPASRARPPSPHHRLRHLAEPAAVAV